MVQQSPINVRSVGYLILRVATLWRVETKTPLGDAGRLDPEKTSPEQLSQIERIAIEFDDVWFDQRDQYYFYKPARLYTRLSLAVPGKIRRQPQHLHPFLDWIFSEAGRLRVEQKDRPSAERTWTLTAPWVELAHQCRMTRQLEHRNYKHVHATLKESAELARTAQIITGYAFDGETFSVTFDHRIFKDLDNYLEKQREKQQRRRRVDAADTTSCSQPQPSVLRRRPALWPDPSQLSLNVINKLIDEHKEAVKKIQTPITSVYDHTQGRNVPSRPFTPEEEDVLDAHRERIEFLTELKPGVRPLPPNLRDRAAGVGAG